jgi:hypothetical protein
MVLSKSFVDGIDQLLSVNQLANQEQSSSDTQTETNDIQSEIDKRYQEKLSELERKYNEERTKIESSMGTSDTPTQITQGIVDKLKETGLSEDVLLLSTDEVNEKLKEIGVNDDLRKQIVGEYAEPILVEGEGWAVRYFPHKYNPLESVGIRTYATKESAQKEADKQSQLITQSIQNRDRNLRKQVIAWHGTPHSFDRFTTDKMGTGEGVQAFGWGLYFTDLESIGRDYADKLGNFNLKVNGKTLDTKIDSKNPLFRVQLSVWGSKNKQDAITKLEDDLSLGRVDRVDAQNAIDYLIEEVETFESIKESSLYKVSLHRGKTPDQYTWLEWDKPISDRALEVFQEFNGGQEIRLAEPSEPISKEDRMTAGQMYKWLEGKVGAKEASLFLLENGIDGIKFPAESIARGATSDNARGFNYVVFDENAITIEERIQFQKALNNVGINLVTNGFTYKDKTGKDVVVLNKDTATDETAIHEFSHIFNFAMRKNRPELYARGIELVSIELEKEESEIKDIIDYVKQTQPDLKGEALAEEILTQLTGVKGAELINSQKQSGLIDWIRSFFTEIGKMFGILDATPEQISTMTLQEFAKASAVQLLKGTNLGTKPAQKNSVDEISELISQKEQEIAKLQEGNSYTIATLDEYKRLQELSIKKQKRTLTPKEEMELAQLTEVVNDWALMTGTVVEGLSLADLILQKAVLENTIIADYDEVGEVTEKDVLEDVLLEETKTKSNYPYAQTYDGVTAVATKEGIEVSGIRPAEFAELAETDDFKVNAQGNAIITEQVRVEINARGKISILPTSKDLATNYNMVLQTLPDMAGVGRTNVLRSTFNSDFNGEMSPESAYDIKTGESVTLEVNPEDAYNQVLLNDYRASRASEPVTEKEISDALSEDTIYIDLQFEIEELTAQEKKATTDKKPSITKKKLKKQESLEKRYQTVKTILNKKQSKGGGNTEAAIQAIKTGLVIRVKNKDGKLVAVLKAIRNTKGVYTNEDIRFESMREQIGDNFDFIERLANTLNTENIPFEGEVTVSNVLLGHPTFNYTVDNGVYSIENRSITEIQAKSVVDVGYVQNGKLFTKSKEMGINTTYLNRSIRESSDNKVPFVVLQKGVHRIAYPVKLVQSQVEGLQEFKDIYESDATIISKIVALNTFMAQKGVDIKQTGNSFTVFNMTDEFFKSKMNQIEGMGKNPNLATWIDPKTTIISNLVGNATINIDIQNPIHSPKLKLDYSGLTVKGMPAQAKTDGKNTPASTIKAGSGMANFLNQCR